MFYESMLLIVYFEDLIPEAENTVQRKITMIGAPSRQFILSIQ